MKIEPNVKWVGRYFGLAHEIGTWSKDPNTHVGAVVVDSVNGQILATGYNGFPRGIEDTEERLVDRSLKLKYTVHAEMNCIYNASLNGVSLNGSTLFVSGLPVCSECAKGIIQSGVKHVFMCRAEDPATEARWRESTDLSLSMFAEAGVNVHWYGESSSSGQTLLTPPVRLLEAPSEDQPSTSSSDGRPGLNSTSLGS